MIIFEHSFATWVIWAGIAIGVAVALYSFWRYVAIEWATIAMAAVRLMFMALLAWCLFQPEWRRALTHMLRPRFVAAVDTSRSMLLSPSEDVSNRWDAARAVLAAPWTTIVGAECEIDAYAFSTEVGARKTVAEIAQVTPDGEATSLRESLIKLTDRYKGQNVGGFLLLSDGLDTREAFDDWAAGPWPWPIYTVRLEPPAAREVEPDVRVDTVSTPRRVSVGWSTELKAVVSGQGTRGEAVNVQLLRNGELLEERPTQIPAEGGAREVAFQLEHPEVGAYTFTVSVPPFPGESYTNDNLYATSVLVVDARNRLLYVEGQPRWESKFLSRALKANGQVTPLTFIRGPGGRFLTLGARGQMTTDMTPAQLAFFKIVILGNLDAKELGEERAENLIEFVDSGGSLVLLGGAKGWGEAGFSATALKKVMPVKRHGVEIIEQTCPVLLTDAGRSHPAFAGDPDLWEATPPILSYFPDVAISAGAETLVAASGSGGPQPIIVTHRYGQGKVVAVFTDSLWKWQLSPGARQSQPYQRFWNQLLMWLSPSAEELDAHEIEVFSDKEQLYLGERIEISARLGGKEEDADSIGAVRCEIITPDKRQIPFTMDSQHVVTPSGKSFPGYAVRFTAQTPGLHSVVAVAEFDGQDIRSDAIPFFVKPFTPESVPRPANLDVLRAVAENSGGRFFRNAEDLDAFLASLRFAGREEESVEYNSLWRNLLIITCLLTLLTIEWGLRKWRNMP